MSSLGRIQVAAEVTPEFSEILTPDALNFIAILHTAFDPTREKLLARRKEIQNKIEAGFFPDFLEETRHIRESDWKAAPIPKDLLDRRVEITGPVDRKMVINALNSGARVYMADFEDSHAPTWTGTIEGQINLRDAVRRKIAYTSPEGKKYSLGEKPATLFVRPRGWHLLEKHLLVDGRPVSASLFDFGLFFFHNAKEQISRGTGPYFYLPKMESHLEARLWNDTFNLAQDTLGIPRGTIRATVLIETILAAFEMDEILHELKEHSAGLNCGRWDYIFSFIKKFRNNSRFILPDRAQVTMNVHFLKSYVHLLIRTCHRRGVHAMGGMAAQIPIKNNPEKNLAAMEKVRNDKLREVKAGHDGTWVAHPGLVGLAQEIFDSEMKGENQISSERPEITITSADLLTVPTGEITETGLKTNVNVALLYLESWLKGVGCVPLYDLMEDAATAEISRAQVWQWIRHGKFTIQKFQEILEKEVNEVKRSRGTPAANSSAEKLDRAAGLLRKIISDENFAEFLTLPAYDELIRGRANE